MNLIKFFKKIFNNKKKVKDNNKKEYTQLIIKDFKKIYGTDDKLEVGLYTYKNKPLVNEKIIININGVDYEKITDKNGIASLSINLKVGKYLTTFNYKGNDNYYSTSRYCNVYVNPIIESDNLLMEYKDGSKFKVKIKDYYGNPLSNEKVTFNINGINYEKVTDVEGIASLNINLSEGNYIISTHIAGVEKINNIIIESRKKSLATGYWIYGRDMYNVNIENLKSNGVTDVFLNFYAVILYGKDKVEDWIEKIKPINVHIWVQSFYDGKWINPAIEDLNFKRSEIKSYSDLKGLYGLHLDYLRYPGDAYKTTNSAIAITNFVKSIKDIIPSTLKLSCAIMPESETKKYYGQDVDELGKILDFIIPMQYKGNYNKGKEWIGSTTKEFSKKATIWSGLQAYKSDNNTTLLPTNELEEDINEAINNNAKGIIIFRYGLSNNINFNKFR